MMTTRVCTVCKKELPATTEYFQKQKTGKYGLQSKCKSCAHEYYLANRQRYIDYSMEWERNNRDKKLANRREWSKKNKDYVKSYQDRQRKLYPDRVSDRIKNWRDRTPESVLKMGKVNAARRQARQRNLPDAYTASDWENALLYWGNRCAVCGRPAGLWHRLAADHWIPLTSPDCPGTIPTNIIPLCHGVGGCNNSKKNKMPMAWLVGKYGQKKAAEISQKVEAYFNSLSKND
jgi:hypothetical protein